MIVKLRTRDDGWEVLDNMRDVHWERGWYARFESNKEDGPSYCAFLKQKMVGEIMEAMNFSKETPHDEMLKDAGEEALKVYVEESPPWSADITTLPFTQWPQKSEAPVLVGENGCFAMLPAIVIRASEQVKDIPVVIIATISAYLCDDAGQTLERMMD